MTWDENGLVFLCDVCLDDLKEKFLEETGEDD